MTPKKLNNFKGLLPRIMAICFNNYAKIPKSDLFIVTALYKHYFKQTTMWDPHVGIYLPSAKLKLYTIV